MDQLKASLESPDVLSELKEVAGLVVENWRESAVIPRPRSLIAGAGIDLSGRLDCNASSCRRAQVDRLFRRTWHYFETIVARDAIAEDLVVHKNCPDSELLERLPPLFETALMVRELGASELVEFLPRVPACFEHWRQHAHEAGIDDIAEQEGRIIDDFARNVRAEISNGQHEVVCALNSPDFSHTQWVSFDPKDVVGKSEGKLVRDAVARVTHMFLVNLTADLNAARKYGGAFGSTIPAFKTLLATRGNTTSNIAVELSLPALEGLSTAQLIEVRFKYGDSFARFQRRIRDFLAECVRDGITAPDSLREKMRCDLIDHELEELRGNLRDAEKSMKIKAAYAATLGTFVATVGVSTGIVTGPVAFGLAASIAGGALSPGVSKHVDEIVRIKSNDLYFLLQAEGHAH
jgi:hypothetical protein